MCILSIFLHVSYSIANSSEFVQDITPGTREMIALPDGDYSGH